MDSIPNESWSRLVRYLSQEATLEEQEETQSWILEDEQRAKLMDELRCVWEETDRSIPSRDVDAAWESVASEIESEAEGAGEVGAPLSPPGGSTEAPSPQAENDSAASRSSIRRRVRGNGRLFMRVSMALGAVAGLVILAFFVLNGEGPLSPEGEARTFSTRPGERATVRLSDGSDVRLNVDSKLTLPADFEGDQREVHLEGEAFFDVASDSARPFIVQMDGASVRVLGTAFGVTAYPEGRRKEVAVREGTVSFQPEQSNQSAVSAPVLLRAHHLGVVAGQHVKTMEGGDEVKQRLAWTEGQLVFDDAPFDEVHRKLERWYDLEIEVRFEPQQVDRLNATFDDSAPMNAVAAVASALGLRYRSEGRTIIFYRQGRTTGGLSKPVRPRSS